MSLIELKKITKTYGKGHAATSVLHNVNVAIEDGEFVALMGPSGSGKTTLMNIIGLLDTPSAGSYFLSSKDASQLSEKERSHLRNEQIGFVFQSFNLLPRLSVSQNISLPMIYHRTSRKTRLANTQSLIKQVGLTRRSDYKPNKLSGGEMQRVAIARALANQPEIVMADEPTGNLDSKTGQSIMKLLKQLNQKGRTVIIVTHDPAIAAYAKRVIHLKDGKIQRSRK